MLSTSAAPVAAQRHEHDLRYRTPEHALVPYLATCLPARGEDGQARNWTLTQLDDTAYKVRLTCALAGRQVHDLYAPTVKCMSGVVLPQSRFTTLFPLNRAQNVKRPGFQQNSNEKTGCDGTTLGMHDAFIMSAGGCPLVVLSGVTDREERLCIAAHAGRDSLIDRHFIQKGVASRAHFSIVDAMVAFARKQAADMRSMTLRSFFALPWERFPHSAHHPAYGLYNGQLQWFYHREQDVFRKREDGELCLDLSALIACQARRHGIGRIETGLLTLPIDGDYAYTTHAEPEMAGTMRNLVTLVRL